MTRETVSLAVLFADIANSTGLYEILGDEIAQNFITSTLSFLSDIVVSHQGTVIKSIGDEIMCSFPDVNDAFDAGIAMHKALEKMPVDVKPDLSPPNIYVGIHMGPVIIEGGDVFGDTVNIAARLTELAKQRQIIATKDTIDISSAEVRSLAQVIEKTVIKGKSGKHKICEVVWEEHDMTVMFDITKVPTETTPLISGLQLYINDQFVEVNENHPAATLGRQRHNDLVVQDRPVSRSHAQIELRRDKFILSDRSSNGTYVLEEGKSEIWLRKDEIPLTGNGIIGLGRKVDFDSPEAIHFAIKL